MGRTITSAANTAASAERVRPVALVHLALDGGDVFVNGSDRSIVYSGDTYLGVGGLGKVTAMQETSALQPSGIRMTLSGIPAAQVAIVLAEPYQGRQVSLYLGLLDDSYALIADPLLVFQGQIDQMGLALGETATITLSAENSLIRWEYPNVRRYTDSDQQQRFPGDLGLQFVSQAVEKEILWGRATK